MTKTNGKNDAICTSNAQSGGWETKAPTHRARAVKTRRRAGKHLPEARRHEPETKISGLISGRE